MQRFEYYYRKKTWILLHSLFRLQTELTSTNTKLSMSISEHLISKNISTQLLKFKVVRNRLNNFTTIGMYSTQNLNDRYETKSWNQLRKFSSDQKNLDKKSAIFPNISSDKTKNDQKFDQLKMSRNLVSICFGCCLIE